MSTDRGLLQSIFNTESDTFEFNNNNYEGWEEDDYCEQSECGSSESEYNDGSMNDSTAHDMNSKARKY